MLVIQSCLTLYSPMDSSPPGSSVHGILQTRIPEWVVIPFSRDPPDPEIGPGSPALAGWFFFHLSHQGNLLEARRGHRLKILPSSLQRKRGPQTPWFQTSSLKECERGSFLTVSHPVYGNLLEQPSEICISSLDSYNPSCLPVASGWVCRVRNTSRRWDDERRKKLRSIFPTSSFLLSAYLWYSYFLPML